MKPYPDAKNGSVERRFNYEQSKARCSIERAFGLLKGRWRILMKAIYASPSTAAIIFVMCWMLHNMLQSKRKSETDEVLDTMRSDIRNLNTNIHANAERKRQLLASVI